jgi:hypothetical protein
MAEGTYLWFDGRRFPHLGRFRSASAMNSLTDEILAPIGSPALDVPVRDRKQAALDIAIDALESCEAFCHEDKAVRYVREKLKRIRDILNS